MVDNQRASETSSSSQVETHEERAKQIFHNVFEPVFVSTCGQALTLEQVKKAFMLKLGDSCTSELENDLDTFFYGADENNDGTLEKAEIRKFILQSL